MKKINIILSLGLVCLFFSACEKNQIKNLTSIGYGTSFGKCIGYCKNSLEITDSKVILFKSTNDGRLREKKCDKAFSTDEFKALTTLLNSTKIATLPETIGCPDCADGGAEWVSANLDGKVYKVTFEYGKAPKELEAVVT